MAATKPLAAKLAEILGEINRVPKSGRNDFHRYDYVTEADLTDAIRPLLAKHGIFLFSSVKSNEVAELTTAKGKTELLTTVHMEFTFSDGETSFTVGAIGTGADAGDKGLYKAITGATKYMLYKNFLVSTGDDPENSGKPSGGSSSQSRSNGSSNGRKSSPPSSNGKSKPAAKKAAPKKAAAKKAAPKVEEPASPEASDNPMSKKFFDDTVLGLGQAMGYDADEVRGLMREKFGDTRPTEKEAWDYVSSIPLKGAEAVAA